MNSLYITCPKCEKIFEVDKDLIPGLGRDVECSSCHNIWFYKGKDYDLNQLNEILENYPSEVPKDIESLILDAEKNQ